MQVERNSSDHLCVSSHRFTSHAGPCYDSTNTSAQSLSLFYKDWADCSFNIWWMPLCTTWQRSSLCWNYEGNILKSSFLPQYQIFSCCCLIFESRVALKMLQIFYKTDAGKLPRIFGMTASPKSGKGNWMVSFLSIFSVASSSITIIFLTSKSNSTLCCCELSLSTCLYYYVNNIDCSFWWCCILACLFEAVHLVTGGSELNPF